MGKKFSALLISSVAAIAVATPASAMEWNVGRVYVRGFAGAILPDDIDTNVAATTGTVTLSTGWTIGAAIGYHFTSWLAAEGEVSYIYANTDELRYLGKTYDVAGHIDSVVGFLNLLIHPFCVDGVSAFDPYIGGGIGVADTTVRITSVGTTVLGPNGIDTGNTNFAANGTAGFNYAVAPGTSIGAQYRYIYTDTGGSSTESLRAHSLTAHVTFTF